MSVCYTDIYALAQKMNSDAEKDEALYRAIVGRAYYSVFYHASEFITEELKVDLKSIEQPTHKKIAVALNEFKSSSSVVQTKLKALSRDIRRLHSLRVDADYRVHTSMGQQEVDQALVEARRLSQRINELPSYGL